MYPCNFDKPLQSEIWLCYSLTLDNTIYIPPNYSVQHEENTCFCLCISANSLILIILMGKIERLVPKIHSSGMLPWLPEGQKEGQVLNRMNMVYVSYQVVKVVVVTNLRDSFH